MLPPDNIVLNNAPFFYYDRRDTAYSMPMITTHFHNFFEVFLLISGSCEYLIGDKIYGIAPYTLVFIPQGDIHKTIYHSKNHERILLSFNEIVIHPALIEHLQQPLFCALKETDQVLDLFRKLSQNADFKNMKNQILITGFLNELLIYMMDNHREIENINVKIPLAIERALSYISENYGSNIALRELAAQYGYSTDYFSKLFKECTGSTFKEYLLLTRFATAEKLLLTTNQSITEIAYSCGFRDSNYFSFMFSKRYGMPPLQYKKQRYH